MHVGQCTSTSTSPPALTSIGKRRTRFPSGRLLHGGQPFSRRHLIGRRCPRFPAPDFHRVLVGEAVRGQVLKVKNASDKAAIALAIDRCPVPNSVHALPSTRRDTTRGVSWGK